MKDDNKPNLFIYILLTVVFVVLIASCGGGGGGGGMLAFAPDNNMPNNGGDAGGWGTGTDTGGGGTGGSTIQEENATLLIGQVAALDVTNVNIVLYINGERFEINNVNETTTTEVLPKISISDTVSGTAYIYVAGESSPREAQLDPTTIGFHNTLRFKVPYRYECIDRGTSARQGTYFYADGIDLTDLTGVRVAGWLDSNGGMHYGSCINGVRGDITLTAVYKVAVTSNVTEISKASALITSLGITQDSAGTPVKPATAQLSVFGSDNYTYSSDAPSKIDISSSGVVSLAAGYTPPLVGETVTITVTDNDDSTLFATTDLKLSSQVVCAIYIDKATCDTNGTPGYTKILDNTVSTAVPPSMNVTPYSLVGATFETQKGKTISAWQYQSSTYAPMVKNGSWLVSGDRKIYAGWPIDGISTTEIVLWRFTDTDTDREAILSRPTGTYSVDWIGANGTSISSCPISHALSGTSDVKISVTKTANLSALADSTNPGVYHATYRVKLQSDPASFTDVPVTVKDAMYVAEEKDADGNVIGGELRFAAGQTIPASLTITPTLVPGYTITKIADNAFLGNTDITSLTINGAIEIGDNAFNCCSNLTTISLTGVKTIGECVFTHAPLNSVTITLDPSVTIFNGFKYANAGDSYTDALNPSSQAVVMIPSGITRIRGFDGAHLKEVHVPLSVTTIDWWAFDQFYGDIYYAGTEAQWNAIIDSKSSLGHATLHYNQY